MLAVEKIGEFGKSIWLIGQNFTFQTFTIHIANSLTWFKLKCQDSINVGETRKEVR